MLIAWRLTLTHRSLSPCPHAVCAQCGEVGVASSATVDMCLNVLHIDPVYMYNVHTQMLLVSNLLILITVLFSTFNPSSHHSTSVTAAFPRWLCFYL